MAISIQISAVRLEAHADTLEHLVRTGLELPAGKRIRIVIGEDDPPAPEALAMLPLDPRD